MRLSLKRNLSLLSMIGVITLTVAACGNNNNEAKSTSAPSTQPASSVEASKEAPSASPEEAKKPDLKALHVYQNDDYNTYPVAKVIEEKTGYKVKYEMLPQDKADDKLNLLIASGAEYDYVFMNGGSNGKALYSDYAKRGALTEIGPLIEEFGPNIKAAIADASWEAVKVEGKIYAIPTSASDGVGFDLIIRQDWLDKVKLPMPTTLEEFTAVLKAFKEQDPGGNGKQNVPFSTRGDYPVLPNLNGAFGIANSYNDVDGKLVPSALDPNFQSYLEYMNDLFKQGLLEKEFAVNKDPNLKEKFTSGKLGVMPAHWADIPTLTDALQKTQPDAVIAYIPSLKGKDGVSGLGSSGGGLDRITFIPKSSKHAEDTIKFLNAKLEKETHKLIAIGEEGKHYTFKDGAYTPILPIFADERNAANNYLTGVDEVNYPIYWQARVRKDPRLFAAWESVNVKLPVAERKPDLLATAPYMPEYTKNYQTLGTLVNEYAVRFIVGSEKAGDIGAFQEKYKSSGRDVSLKEINDWYTTK
ncbi:extracellular solute-binding protein [Cohnella sp. WQ 127256]|uniref:extracellular solute-binding protein n=1 Tax=Cohnella sp. WQ 127256 TaxID=2938790 RepID=UPI00211901B6|nr:extracellular solute-binding protein [Cohnella sp. WQ 127256]